MCVPWDRVRGAIRCGCERLRQHGEVGRPILVDGRGSDWTLRCYLSLSLYLSLSHALSISLSAPLL
jgi:hypothetical protein